MIRTSEIKENGLEDTEYPCLRFREIILRIFF